MCHPALDGSMVFTSSGKPSFSNEISMSDVIDIMKNIHMNTLAHGKLYLGKGVLSTETMFLL